MSGFQKVSLGFAEFVSTLLHDVFDAAIDAQNHQFEKYMELERMIKLSNEEFANLYLSQNEVLNKEEELFSSVLSKKSIITESIYEAIEDNITEDINLYVKNKKLTEKGFTFLKEYSLDLLIQEKKDYLSFMLNKYESSNIAIESGEIKAKIELSNMYIDNEEKIENKKILSKKLLSKKEEITLEEKTYIKEYTDSDTNEKVLIINKDEIKKQDISTITIPNTRVIARPIDKNSTSNLYSEITIRFKTI
ncbi:hypothetical protein [Arcobacter sp. LA11]|uniref:hypothetical protein n=1 Tax=Arcobacter sp. LA11 TaxID=1898176 RepID=UPI0009327763|nr:hypothetical protein [Arcobacter sp. LA11]